MSWSESATAGLAPGIAGAVRAVPETAAVAVPEATVLEAVESFAGSADLDLARDELDPSLLLPPPAGPSIVAAEVTALEQALQQFLARVQTAAASVAAAPSLWTISAWVGAAAVTAAALEVGRRQLRKRPVLLACPGDPWAGFAEPDDAPPAQE